MSESEEQPHVPVTREPHSVGYYKRLLMLGNGTQWRVLMQDIKKDFDIAYRVAQACGQLSPEYKTVQTLWKGAIETAQPSIKIRVGKDLDESLKVRHLKQSKYS